MTLVRAEVRGGVAVLCLARPTKRNALLPEMLHDLGAGVSRLAAGARAILLAGEGPVFCSGFDLAYMAGGAGGSGTAELLRGLWAAITDLRGADVPVVAAVRGAAIAGGCALLGAADVVVADRAARFGYPVSLLGLSPAVSAPTLAGAVGTGAARRLLVDPGLIDADEARRIGLVHEVVERPDEVLPAALEIAEALAAKPPGALRETKRWLREIDPAGRDHEGDADRALAVSLATAASAEHERLIAAAMNRPAGPRPEPSR